MQTGVDDNRQGREGDYIRVNSDIELGSARY